jgi:phosphoribosyl-AMP cyclohydrolase
MNEIESGTRFAPKFDGDGLIVSVVTDTRTGGVLMVAHMDRQALARTIETGEAWFWSRSRQKYWRKGEESGNLLAVSEMRVDCDQDVILISATIAGDGVACHQGYRSCFYRTVPIGKSPDSEMALQLDRQMERKTRR